MHKLLACVLVSMALFGCKSSTEAFVDSHYRGYTILRGTLRSVEGLRTSKWEHLTDGIALEVGDPGCQITIQQGEGDTALGAQTFRLKARDHIIWSESDDFVLKALEEDRGLGGAQAAPVQSAPPSGN